jgi:hypothetical protein
MKSIIVAGLAAFLLTGSVLAQTPAERREHRAEQRQHRQDVRIDKGVASGSVTPHEATHLEHQQRHIDHVEKHAMADGTMNHREAQRMGRMQDRASRNIHHQKHDRQHRP